MIYHYTESGLTDIYLHGGVEKQETAYGTGYSIHDVDGLHEVIGRYLVSLSEPWLSCQVRFLRGELTYLKQLFLDLWALKLDKLSAGKKTACLKRTPRRNDCLGPSIWIAWRGAPLCELI